MTRTLNLGPKSPDYMQRSLLKVMLGGIYQGLTSGAKAFKGGDYWQVGGEFLLQDNETLWCHRMTNTRDHAEVPVLRKVVGLDEERPPLKKRWSVTNGAVRRSLSLRRQSWRKRSRSRSQERKGKEVNGAQDAIKEEDKENIPVAERSSEVSVQS